MSTSKAAPGKSALREYLSSQEGKQGLLLDVDATKDILDHEGLNACLCFGSGLIPMSQKSSSEYIPANLEMLMDLCRYHTNIASKSKTYKDRQPLDRVFWDQVWREFLSHTKQDKANECHSKAFMELGNLLLRARWKYLQPRRSDSKDKQREYTRSAFLGLLTCFVLECGLREIHKLPIEKDGEGADFMDVNCNPNQAKYWIGELGDSYATKATKAKK